MGTSFLLLDNGCVRIVAVVRHASLDRRTFYGSLVMVLMDFLWATLYNALFMGLYRWILDTLKARRRVD